ncbi:MAG: DNA replication/repair protein RecF, partial [Candidatus Caldatribacteriaceae bacterium]
LLHKNGGKRWRVNGKRIIRRENVWLVGYFPEDIEIVGGAPRDRREFLDEALSFLFPIYYQFLKNYEKAVERRNILLREGDSGKIIPAYTERMIALGAKIVEWRVKYIRALVPFFREVYRDIFGENEPELQYRSEGYSWEKGIEQGLREAGEALKKEEREKGMTLFGPHRDEIVFFLNGQEVRDFASQGEKKGITLSLRMAEMEIIRRNKDDRVVVLLDDLFSEFDERRQSLVLKRVGKEGQVFITTTEKRRAEEAVSNFGAWGFWMEDGKMERWC